MNLFDAHCHLQDERLAPYLEDVLARARGAGVRGFACNGSSEADWPDVAGLARKNTDIHPWFGLHPWYTKERGGDWLGKLSELLDEFPGAGVGEAGLDHAIDGRDDEDQRRVFAAQLELARRKGRPISIHCRRAWGAMLDCLRPFGVFEHGFILHSFSGSHELIGELAALGAMFSFSGSVTLSGNRRGRRALGEAPQDRLLIETDSPDLVPHFHDNIRPGDPALAAQKINEPVNLLLVLKTAAAIRQISEFALADRLWQNMVSLGMASPSAE